MSGGSFNYLYNVDVRDLFDRAGDIREMADALSAYEAKDAAIETESILLIVSQFEVRMRARLNRLQKVWKAVEWHHSSDWSKEQVEAELANYRGENS